MKTIPINAGSAPRAASGYSQAAEVEGARRLVFVSGQIPQSSAGDVPKEFPAQARLLWHNVLAQLAAPDMTVSNLTKVTIFPGSRGCAEANRDVRQEFLGSHRH
jgi:2-iminobutanoate/2-iminopropanoate deaminase